MNRSDASSHAHTGVQELLDKPFAEDDRYLIPEDARVQACVLVTHPQEETVWCGGTMLRRPKWDWHVVAIGLGRDSIHRRQFDRALDRLGASGAVGDLLPDASCDMQTIERIVEELAATRLWDAIYTHNPWQDDAVTTRVGKTALRLWGAGKLRTASMRVFAHERIGDGNRFGPPNTRTDPCRCQPMSGKRSYASSPRSTRYARAIRVSRPYPERRRSRASPTRGTPP